MSASIPLSAIQAASAGTALDVVTSGGALSGGLSALSASNPYMAAFQIATGLFGGGSVKISGTKADGSGLAQSGLTDFNNDDLISFKKRAIDLSTMQGVLIAGALVVGSIYAIKKIKRFK